MAASTKLVVIVGATASGKSQEALSLAQQQNGEIICADSRTIYRGMDIGTAKPSKQDRALVPHHLIDVVTPDQPFAVADFQRLANQAIKDIQSRGKLPIMVGGTGLYIDSILYDFSFRPPNPEQRQTLEKLTVNELQALIKEQGLDLPENKQNPRHLVRVLETQGQVSQKQSLRANTLVLGLDCPPEQLKQRIADRVDQMVADGLEAEVKALADRYGWEAEAIKGIGYREWQAKFDGQQDLIKTKELIIKNSWQYVRRQRTWFRRNHDIHWNLTGKTGIEQPSATIVE